MPVNDLRYLWKHGNGSDGLATRTVAWRTRFITLNFLFCVAAFLSSLSQYVFLSYCIRFVDIHLRR